MSTYEIHHKLKKYNDKRRQAQTSDRIGYYDRKIQHYSDLLQTGGADDTLSEVIGKAIGDIGNETQKATKIQISISKKVKAITSEIEKIKGKISQLEKQVKVLKEMNDTLGKIPETLDESANILLGKDASQAGGSESSHSGKGFFSELFD